MSDIKTFDIETHVLPEGLTFNSPIHYLYGFKIFTNPDGKPVWIPASEEDYRRSESKRLNVPSDAVPMPFECRAYAPGLCSNGCFNGFCTNYYDSEKKYYYCACS